MSGPAKAFLLFSLSLSLVDVLGDNPTGRSETYVSPLIPGTDKITLMQHDLQHQPAKAKTLRSWLDLSNRKTSARSSVLLEHPQTQKLGQGVSDSKRIVLEGTNSTQDSKTEEQENKKQDEEDKVRLGIEGASEKDRSSEIWRCPHIPHVDPSKMSQPNVSVGMYILNLHAEDRGLSTGEFFADFLLFLRQKDKPLTQFDGMQPIDELAFTNAMSIDSISQYGKGVRRVAGKFFFSPDLRWYPFDKQYLEIVLEQFKSPVTLWVFVPDADLNGMSPSIRFPGWQTSLRQSPTSLYANCRARVSTKVYPGASSDEQSSSSNITFSRFTFSIAVQRPIYEGVITKFVPPFVMLAPTLYSFWLDPTVNWSIRITMGSGGLISIVFFHSSISNQIILGLMIAVIAASLWILSIYADAKAAAQGYVNMNFANS
ncbi:hypothetical protein GUITHDRAFT_112030 [Guillardia theta CCMP2712]|uniref:Uncharacterized protein n=1 Tax=Guillardia theta (strain CCMP2712) TaxID=905079 RepID=L1J174_GUITC|nr:hypothetical protein GUITHDRAFT_112030 [Guillardia theta CCMP2712]EKX41889.1 hypothetical protein GUITHDRAFT_112030 [Guillardia theta CCMP2712]|eukprot:XP_005828869.1 hypothetical protein GUITHDRAFT_112030 [Guillardia theta CCMP2712]